MKLGINGWRIHGPQTGVGRYLLNIVKYWTPDVISDKFNEITFYSPEPIDRQEIPIPENIHIKVLTPNWKVIAWENLLFGPIANDDVLFNPSYSRPLMARGKTVVTTHDATSKLYPKLFPNSVRFFYNPLYGWSARNATLVITDSDAARQDIANCWGVPLSNIRVVYLAAAENFKPVSDNGELSQVRHRYVGSNSPFFLFVGKLSGRRSIPLLFKAFAEFKSRTSHPHKLVMVGLNIHNLKVSEMISELGLLEHIRYAGYISDAELNMLYNAADAFISPSIYETVSLPVMEAQATGTSVICIDTQGMREITGGAAFLISKPEMSEMFEAMSCIADDENLRHELEVKGLKHSQNFSWKRCSAETLAVLEEAAQM